MNIHIVLALVVVFAILIKAGKVTNVLNVFYSEFVNIFFIPGNLYSCWRTQVKHRKLQSVKPCPCCETEMIREDDSICDHCKLEVSLGLDVDQTESQGAAENK